MPRVSHAAASLELAGRDPVIKRLYEMVGPFKPRKPFDSPFAALARAVCYQQLAGKAAASIHGRFVEMVGEVTPQAVLAHPEGALRAAGLSGAKEASIRDLAVKALDGTVELDMARLRKLSDDEIVENLSTVRGIGRWTAEMFLMFDLRRIDVWPTGDYGVRNGYRVAWGLAEMPTPKQLELLGDPFRPYRSVAAWYCWRAIDVITP